MTADDAKEQVAEFVKANVLEQIDAQAELDKALEEAKSSGRNVWLQYSQTRCAPCIVLSRWVDEHKAVLEKDYVILKIDTFRDEHGADIWQAEVGDRVVGIPFTVILDADGTTLVNSIGPLGNTGSPSTFEDKQVFRTMFEKTATSLSAEEIDSLIKSIGE